MSDPATMNPPAAFAGPRDFPYIRPAGRRLTEYEALNLYVHTLDSSRPGPVAHPAGWPVESTEVRSADWFAFRDPAQMWQRPYIKRQAEQERAIERAMASGRANGAVRRIDDRWAADILGNLYVPAAFFEHAMFRALSHASLLALSDVLSVAMVFNSFDKERHAQDILFHQHDLVKAGCPVGAEDRLDAWLQVPELQPLRRLAERINGASDWVEVAVAVNLVIEPILGQFLFNEVIWNPATAHGDTLTPVLLMEAENDRQRNIAWTASLVTLLLDEGPDRQHNRGLLNGWVSAWLDPTVEAARGLDPIAKLAGVDGSRTLEAVGTQWQNLLEALGLESSGITRLS